MQAPQRFTAFSAIGQLDSSALSSIGSQQVNRMQDVSGCCSWLEPGFGLLEQQVLGERGHACRTSIGGPQTCFSIK